VKYSVHIEFKYNIETGLNEPVVTEHFYKLQENNRYLHVFRNKMINIVLPIQIENVILKEITKEEFDDVISETLETLGIGRVKHNFL